MVKRAVFSAILLVVLLLITSGVYLILQKLTLPSPEEEKAEFHEMLSEAFNSELLEQHLTEEMLLEKLSREARLKIFGENKYYVSRFSAERLLNFTPEILYLFVRPLEVDYKTAEGETLLSHPLSATGWLCDDLVFTSVAPFFGYQQVKELGGSTEVWLKANPFAESSWLKEPLVLKKIVSLETKQDLTQSEADQDQFPSLGIAVLQRSKNPAFPTPKGCPFALGSASRLAVGDDLYRVGGLLGAPVTHFDKVVQLPEPLPGMSLNYFFLEGSASLMDDLGGLVFAVNNKGKPEVVAVHLDSLWPQNRLALGAVIDVQSVLQALFKEGIDLTFKEQ